MFPQVHPINYYLIRKTVAPVCVCVCVCFGGGGGGGWGCLLGGCLGKLINTS